MTLSRLYSNQPSLFEPVDFTQGLNAVMAEIRLPENRNKDTHNLGKTTLGRLLDFGFLARRDAKFFLFKHLDVFKDFVFFLEIELEDASFVTVRRSMEEATKISFKRHEAGHQDFSALPISHWDHQQMPFERARDLLDGLLDWRALKPWSYRKGLGYLLRSQADFREVFQLRNFVSRHSGWKPFLAHILGFNAQLVAQHYEKEDEFAKKQKTAQTIKNELGGSVEDISKIEGILLLKQKEVEKKQKLLDAFDFRAPDKDRTKQLIAFNRAITDERRGYLQEERAEVEVELKRINAELNSLGKRRSDTLSFLSSTDIFGKYKEVSDEMVMLRADITSLERQRGFLHRLQELRGDIRGLTEECGHLQTQVEADVEKQNSDQDSLFSAIRLFFSEIVEDVVDRKKENLLAVIRRYSELGLQPVITLIDSDLPARTGDGPVIADDEITLTLHDESEQGRLFKMAAW